MIRGKNLERVTNAVLSLVVAGAVALATSYIGVTRGQAVHETRLTTVENTVKDDRTSHTLAIQKEEEQLNQRLDSIQLDVREIRKAQDELLRQMALGKR
jgi:hypothetical protein